MSALCKALTFHTPSSMGHTDSYSDPHPPLGRTTCRNEIRILHPFKHKPRHKSEKNHLHFPLVL